MFPTRRAPRESIPAAIEAKTPVMEHKGLFSGVVVFLIQVSHLQWFRVLCDLPPRFSICLAPGETPVDEEKVHQDARNAAERGHLQGRCAGCVFRSYDSPSAFMRAAIEKELRGAYATLDESEQRIIASLERYSKQIRRVARDSKLCLPTWTPWPR
jgi:hypothetical protein